MTPQEFIAKWKRSRLSERSASQQHFLDLCELLGQEKPAAADPDGTEYTFERGVSKTGGGNGWADVWKRHYFAWEAKGDEGAIIDIRHFTCNNSRPVFRRLSAKSLAMHFPCSVLGQFSL